MTSSSAVIDDDVTVNSRREMNFPLIFIYTFTRIKQSLSARKNSAVVGTRADVVIIISLLLLWRHKRVYQLRSWFLCLGAIEFIHFLELFDHIASHLSRWHGDADPSVAERLDLAVGSSLATWRRKYKHAVLTAQSCFSDEQKETSRYKLIFAFWFTILYFNIQNCDFEVAKICEKSLLKIFEISKLSG